MTRRHVLGSALLFTFLAFCVLHTVADAIAWFVIP